MKFWHEINFIFGDSDISTLRVSIKVIWPVNWFWLESLVIWDAVEEMVDAIQSSVLLHVGRHVVPRVLLGVRIHDHTVLNLGVLDPFVEGLKVHGRELPSFDGGVKSGLESLHLDIW